MEKRLLIVFLLGFPNPNSTTYDRKLLKASDEFKKKTYSCRNIFHVFLNFVKDVKKLRFDKHFSI